MKLAKVVVTIGLILLSMAGLGGCGGERELVEMAEAGQKGVEKEMIMMPISENETLDAKGDSGENESDEMTKLTALADDLEEAEKIADLYGIELDSYSYGVAVYVTDKDVQELISMGEENDYPTLAPNHKDKLHTVQ